MLLFILSVPILHLLALLIILRFLCYPRPAVIPFRNRNVLITGGSSGIGLEIARRAILEGASVSILARDPGRLAEAKKTLEKATGKLVKTFAADVKDYESLQKVASEIGQLDILICSHGVPVAKAFVDTSLQDINDVLDINLRGNINVVKAMLPCIKSRKDRRCAAISIVSSQAGQVGIYGFVAYSASKFGLRGMAEALQQELISDNIRISLIYPPDTLTSGFDKENETKPELTKVLSGSSSVMTARDVAKKAVIGIKAGKFNISCNFDGQMLCFATAGMSPQPSAVVALGEIFFCGLLRLVALCVTWNWYRTIISWHKRQNKMK